MNSYIPENQTLPCGIQALKQPSRENDGNAKGSGIMHSLEILTLNLTSATFSI